MITFKKKFVQKFIAGFLILAILTPAAYVGFAMPKKASADIPVIDIPNLMNIIKEIIVVILKNFLKKIATKLLDKMTQSTINWVNGGFQGAPLFIENPGSFFKNVVHTELAGFINETAYDKVKFPFGRDYAIGIINKATGTYAQTAQYSLSQLYANNPTEYARQQNDFAAGGFNGLLMNTQQLQNNFLGYGLLADNEVNQRLTGTYSKPQDVANKVSQGSGYLSQLTCKSNPNWNPEMEAQAIAKGPADPDYQATMVAYSCPEGASATTPGRTAADNIMTALGSKQRQGELSAQAGNALAAIFDAVINKFIDKGLTAVSNLVAGNGNPPTPDPLTVKLKDFNQFGDKGTSEKAGYLGAPPTATAPHVSVTVNIINDDGGQTYDPGILQAYMDDNAIKTNTPINATVCPDANPCHQITLQDVVGYYKIITGDCDRNGYIHLSASEDTTCVFTLDDIPGNSARNSGDMMVTADVINDNDGKYLTPLVTGEGLGILVDNAPRLSGIAYKYPEGWHAVTVTLPDKGYTLTYSSGCNAQGEINVISSCTNGVFGVGQTCDNNLNVCTVTLNDVPGWHLKREQINIQIINDAAVPGTLTASQVQILVDGSNTTIVPPASVITNGASNIYSAGDSKTAPDHAVTVLPLGLDPNLFSNYTISYDGNCDSNGVFSLIHSGGAKDANGVETDVGQCTVVFDDNN